MRCALEATSGVWAAGCSGPAPSWARLHQLFSAPGTENITNPSSDSYSSQVSSFSAALPPSLRAQIEQRQQQELLYCFVTYLKMMYHHDYSGAASALDGNSPSGDGMTREFVDGAVRAFLLNDDNRTRQHAILTSWVCRVCCQVMGQLLLSAYTPFRPQALVHPADGFHDHGDAVPGITKDLVTNIESASFSVASVMYYTAMDAYNRAQSRDRGSTAMLPIPIYQPVGRFVLRSLVNSIARGIGCYTCSYETNVSSTHPNSTTTRILSQCIPIDVTLSSDVSCTDGSVAPIACTPPPSQVRPPKSNK